MKTRKIRIKIKSLDQALNEFVATAKAIKQGRKVTPKRGTYIADAETARAIFTESRLRLIQTLKEQSPRSIYELAKILHRDFKNVYGDVVFLAELGIVGIRATKEGRRQKKPALLCENILFELAA